MHPCHLKSSVPQPLWEESRNDTKAQGIAQREICWKAKLPHFRTQSHSAYFNTTWPKERTGFRGNFGDENGASQFTYFPITPCKNPLDLRNPKKRLCTSQANNPAISLFLSEYRDADSQLLY